MTPRSAGYTEFNFAFADIEKTQQKAQRYEPLGCFASPPGTRPDCPPRRRCPAWLAPLATGACHPARLPNVVVAPRHHGRVGTDHHAGARRYRLCGGLGRARHLRPLRHHYSLAGLCLVRPQPDPGAGPGLLPGGRDSRRGLALVRRRPTTRCRPGRHDGDRIGGGVHPRGYRALGLHHRAFVQADPLWLHERDRPDRVDQPVAQAFRLFD
ncbi:hypothetical protein D3C76_793010 [compost metagenome]